MKKIKAYVFLFFVALMVNVTYGQYVRNFQAVYPFYGWNNPTKNYTFTKEFNNNGYFLTAVSNISYAPVTALAALKLDNDFNIQWTRSFFPVGCYENSTIETRDVTATSDGGYIACGVFSRCNNYKASFIVKFDQMANPQWMKSYPIISVLNSIVEQRSSSSDIVPVYVACGKSGIALSSQGVILKVNNTGIPLWQRNTATNGKRDRIVFNDIIQATNILTPTNAFHFAIVGNVALNSQNNNEDVILTLIDTNGNVRYCYTYGIKNTEKEHYIERGYAITVSENKNFVISGCAGMKVYNSHYEYQDALLFEVVPYNGNFNWARRYDVFGNKMSEEPAMDVKVYKDYIYAAGYQNGYIFNPNQSYDAFLIKTKIDGYPVENRIFGDKGNDLFFKLEVNIKGDGMVPVGFSSSYNNLQNPAPYIVESYPFVIERCYDIVLKLPDKKMEFKVEKVPVIKIETEYIPEKLEEIDNPVDPKVLCKKEPLPIITPKSGKEKERTIENISVSPIPAISSIRIDGLDRESEYTIVNLMGRSIKSGKTVNGAVIGIDELREGVYFIWLRGKEKVMKFVKIK